MREWSLEPFVRRFFEAWGPCAYTLKWPLTIIPILVSVALSFGLLRLQSLRVDDPSYVFTPKAARWRSELQVFSDNWPLHENKFLPGKSFETKRFINILVKAKDHGDILREPILKEIQLLNSWIMNNITVPTDDKKYTLNYQDLCLSYDWVCGGNEHIEMLIQRHRVGQVIDLHYPRGGSQDTPIYLGSTLGDVKLFPNQTVDSATITQLVYFLKQEQSVVRKYSSDFSYAVERFLLKVYDSQLITVTFAHYQSLQDGLDENAEHFTPNFIFSFVVLTVFALCSSISSRKDKARSIDWITSKPWLACAGLSTTLLAIGSGFGFLLLLGVNYNVINTIIPFLIIAIGIDDMFIMCACWHSSDPSASVPVRMSQTLSHGGVAITITNITDIMSFAIGCITDLPGIQLFCIYASVSITFCYIYQITFFCGMLALMGDVEEQGRHSLFLYKMSGESKTAKSDATPQKRIAYPENLRKFQRTSMKSYTISDFSDISSRMSTDSGICSNDRMDSSFSSSPSSSPASSTQLAIPKKSADGHYVAEKTKIVKWVGEKYAPFLLHNAIRTLSTLLFIIYMAVAVYGCSNFREGLNPANLVTNDHYIAKYFEDIKFFWQKGPQLHVAVLDPPNLVNETQRNRLLGVVAAFENTDVTMGREGTVFFLLEYLNYLDEVNAELENTDNLWNLKLRKWLKYTGGASQWESDIRYNKTDNSFQAYRFTVAMKNIVEPNQHKHAAKMLRGIADRQPFNVQIFHEAFPFADQYLIILPATISNIAISLICMSSISFLLVPSLPSGFVIFFSIISIAVGVFGYMTLWGVNLDAVSMISLIMSIGFAVDLSAHIIYAFVTSKGDSKERVIGALETLGWPIFQGATSTIAGVSILYTVDAYIILTFFKTIWLTMVIGAIHGLFFIPVFLSLVPVSFFRIPESASGGH